MNRSEAHEALVDELLLALSATKICKVWRQPTGGAYRGKKLIRYGKKGSGDISGILINGRRLEIECKTGKADQMVHQRAFGKMILSFGGVYIVARDVFTTVAMVIKEAGV